MTTDKCKWRVFSLVFAGSLAALPMEAFSQIEEIIVTTRKREESLQDIPISVVAFDSAAIERNNIRDVKDLARFTPGLVFDEGFVPEDTRPQIRGLSAERGRPPLAILVDGIDVSSQAIRTAGGGMLMNPRLLDVERIEVVKGPQSALYGRVAFGGAINYITRKPADEFEGSASLDVGDYGQLELRSSVSGPVDEDGKIGVRVTAAYAEHDGYYSNALTGADLGGFDSIGGSLAARFEMDENFTVDTRISYSKDDYEPRAQHLLATVTNTSVEIPLPDAAIGPLFPGIFGPAPLPATRFVPNLGEITALDQIFLSVDPLTGEDYPGAKFDSLIANVRAEYTFSDVTLTSWTGYVDAKSDTRQDVDFFGAADAPVLAPRPGGVAEPLVALFERAFLTKTQQFNQELRLSDLESEGFRWAVGGQFWHEDVSQTDTGLLSILFGFPFAPPSAALNAHFIGPRPAREGEGRKTEHWSIYGIAEYDLTDTLTASMEARYSFEDFVYDWYTSGGSAIGFAAFAPVGISPSVLSHREDDDSFFAPRFTLEYQATDDALLYAFIAKGVKPGGFSTIGGTAPEKARFKSEKLWTYEAGAKTTWADDRLTLNGAFFFMDYTDQQVTLLEADPMEETGFTLVVRNAGKSEVIGLEFEMAAAPTEAITLTAGYTYLDTEYVDFTLNTTGALDIARAGNCVLEVVAGTNTCRITYNGNRIERAPKHSLTLSASYQQSIKDGYDLVVDVSGQYQSKRFAAPDQLHFFGSYWNWDARVGVETETWSVFVYGENIFDEDTVRSGETTGDFFALGNLAISTFAPPKPQGGVRLNVRF